MRKLCVAAVLASTIMTAPAFAKDGYWYGTLVGGPSLFENQGHRVVTNGQAAPVTAVRTSTFTGFNVSGELGYDFGLLRTGFEIGYQRAPLSTVFNDANIAIVGASGVNSPVNGSSNVLTLMTNLLFDVANNEKWTGSVGGGIGFAQYEASRFATGALRPFVNDSDTRFAWQILAGLRRSISESVDLNLGYKWLSIENINLVTANATPLQSSFRSHSLLIGFTYNFGGAEPPAPPPPPPPPAPEPAPPPPPPEPAPPPPPPPPPGPFIIFFDWNKATITPEANQILSDAAAAFKSSGQVSIQLAGHADKSGTDAYNDKLSERRAEAARKRLSELGVPVDVVSTTHFGEAKPLVDTADGTREPQNRRVEITFPPKQ